MEDHAQQGYRSPGGTEQLLLAVLHATDAHGANSQLQQSPVHSRGATPTRGGNRALQLVQLARSQLSQMGPNETATANRLPTTNIPSQPLADLHNERGRVSDAEAEIRPLQPLMPSDIRSGMVDTETTLKLVVALMDSGMPSNGNKQLPDSAAPKDEPIRDNLHTSQIESKTLGDTEEGARSFGPATDSGHLTRAEGLEPNTYGTRGGCVTEGDRTIVLTSIASQQQDSSTDAASHDEQFESPKITPSPDHYMNEVSSFSLPAAQRVAISQDTTDTKEESLVPHASGFVPSTSSASSAGATSLTPSTPHTLRKRRTTRTRKIILRLRGQIQATFSISSSNGMPSPYAGRDSEDMNISSDFKAFENAFNALRDDECLRLVIVQEPEDVFAACLTGAPQDCVSDITRNFFSQLPHGWSETARGRALTLELIALRSQLRADKRLFQMELEDYVFRHVLWMVRFRKLVFSGGGSHIQFADDYERNTLDELITDYETRHHSGDPKACKELRTYIKTQEANIRQRLHSMLVSTGTLRHFGAVDAHELERYIFSDYGCDIVDPLERSKSDLPYQPLYVPVDVAIDDEELNAHDDASYESDRDIDNEPKSRSRQVTKSSPHKSVTRTPVISSPTAASPSSSATKRSRFQEFIQKIQPASPAAARTLLSRPGDVTATETRSNADGECEPSSPESEKTSTFCLTPPRSPSTAKLLRTSTTATLLSPGSPSLSLPQLRISANYPSRPQLGSSLVDQPGVSITVNGSPEKEPDIRKPAVHMARDNHADHTTNQSDAMSIERKDIHVEGYGVSVENPPRAILNDAGDCGEPSERSSQAPDESPPSYLGQKDIRALRASYFGKLARPQLEADEHDQASSNSDGNVLDTVDINKHDVAPGKRGRTDEGITSLDNLPTKRVETDQDASRDGDANHRYDTREEGSSNHKDDNAATQSPVLAGAPSSGTRTESMCAPSTSSSPSTSVLQQPSSAQLASVMAQALQFTFPTEDAKDSNDPEHLIAAAYDLYARTSALFALVKEHRPDVVHATTVGFSTRVLQPGLVEGIDELLSRFAYQGWTREMIYNAANSYPFTLMPEPPIAPSGLCSALLLGQVSELSQLPLREWHSAAESFTYSLLRPIVNAMVNPQLGYSTKTYSLERWCVLVVDQRANVTTRGDILALLGLKMIEQTALAALAHGRYRRLNATGAARELELRRGWESTRQSLLAKYEEVKQTLRSVRFEAAEQKSLLEQELNSTREHVTRLQREVETLKQRICLNEEERSANSQKLREHAALTGDVETLTRLSVRELDALQLQMIKSQQILCEARKSRQECIICMDSYDLVVFLPCKHRIACSNCLERLTPRVCPLCKLTITNSLVPRGAD